MDYHRASVSMHRSAALCCLRVMTVSVLLATVMALAARAQSPMVELRLQLKPGEMLAYEFAFSSRETVKGDVQDTIDSKSQGYEVVRVLDVGRSEERRVGKECRWRC